MPFSQGGITALQAPSISKFEQADRGFTGGGEHGSQGRAEQRDAQAIALATLARRSPEGAMERRAKSAVGVIAMTEDDIVQRRTVTDGDESPRKPLASAPGGKGHPVMTLEPAAHLFRGQSLGAQIGGGKARFGIRGNPLHEARNPFRRLAICEFGLATLAGTISGPDGRTERREEFDVF